MHSTRPRLHRILLWGTWNEFFFRDLRCFQVLAYITTGAGVTLSLGVQTDSPAIQMKLTQPGVDRKVNLNCSESSMVTHPGTIHTWRVLASVIGNWCSKRSTRWRGWPLKMNSIIFQEGPKGCGSKIFFVPTCHLDLQYVYVCQNLLSLVIIIIIIDSLKWKLSPGGVIALGNFNYKSQINDEKKSTSCVGFEPKAYWLLVQCTIPVHHRPGYELCLISSQSHLRALLYYISVPWIFELSSRYVDPVKTLIRTPCI